MPKSSAVTAIEARQKREDFMRDFHATRAQEARQRMQSEWVNKTDARVEQKDLFRHLDVVQAQHNDALVERRKRLAALLLREKEEHDGLLDGLTETDEQRRERLLRKAQALRDRREDEKRADTAQRHDRLFREKIDLLRQAESRLKVMQVADARFAQLSEAEVRSAQAREEELFFTQQATEAQRVAAERAQQDLETIYLRQERLKGDLAAQVAGNEMRKRMEADEKKLDDAEFYRLLHEERVMEAQKALARRERQQQIAAEMKALNEELERARKEEYDRLKQEDKELLDSILAELAAEKVAQAEEKQRRKEAEWAAMEDLQRQMDQKKDDSKALDKLWEEANNKEWAKREMRWDADKAKRDALLRNILIVRRQQVLDKRQLEKDTAESRRREHAEFLASLDDGKETEARAQRKRLEAQQEMQRHLDMQISQRRQEKEAELLVKRNALTEQQALEAIYQERITQEMANLEAAKPDRYRHVPLLPAHQRNQPF